MNLTEIKKSYRGQFARELSHGSNRHFGTLSLDNVKALAKLWK